MNQKTLLSVPAIILFKLSMCFKHITAALVVAAAVNTKGVLSAQHTIGMDNAAITDAREAYLKTAKTATHMINEIIIAGGIMNRRAPREVATPLPPLKPAKIGKTWPKTTKTAVAATQKSSKK